MAQPKLTGICPGCGNAVIAHCGEIYNWHWKHKSGESCDVWFESESKWHLDWKRKFSSDNTEVRIGDKSHWHIADIFTKDEVVIELQYSPIDKRVIEIRENFYGEKMLWILESSRLSMYISELDNINISLRLPFNIFFDREIKGVSCWFIDLMEYIPTANLREAMKKLGIRYDKIERLYYKYSSYKSFSRRCFELELDRSLVDELKIFSGDLLKKEPLLKKFSLHKNQETWLSSKRPKFIDGNKNDLYWIQNPLRSGYGLIKVIKKETFLKKYNGT